MLYKRDIVKLKQQSVYYWTVKKTFVGDQSGLTENGICVCSTTEIGDSTRSNQSVSE